MGPQYIRVSVDQFWLDSCVQDVLPSFGRDGESFQLVFVGERSCKSLDDPAGCQIRTLAYPIRDYQSALPGFLQRISRSTNCFSPVVHALADFLSSEAPHLLA